MAKLEISQEIEQFLEDQPNLILATLRSDGVPQLSPVWFIWRDGAFVISTMRSTAKWANLLREPRCSGIVDDPEGQYVHVSGVATLMAEEEPLDISSEIVRHYKPGDLFEPYMNSVHERGNRGIIRLAPDRIITRNFK